MVNEVLFFCGFGFIKHLDWSPLFWPFAPLPSGKYFSKYLFRLCCHSQMSLDALIGMCIEQIQGTVVTQ